MENGAEFREGVLRLAEAGRITAEEGEALLRAGQGGRFKPRALWDPAGTLSPKVLRGLGALSLLGAVLVARAGCRFDGTLDMHVGLASLPFLAWNLTLLVSSLRHASGLRGLRLALTAGGGILVAEIGSKILLMVLS